MCVYVRHYMYIIQNLICFGTQWNWWGMILAKSCPLQWVTFITCWSAFLISGRCSSLIVCTHIHPWSEGGGGGDEGLRGWGDIGLGWWGDKGLRGRGNEVLWGGRGLERPHIHKVWTKLMVIWILQGEQGTVLYVEMYATTYKFFHTRKYRSHVQRSRKQNWSGQAKWL